MDNKKQMKNIKIVGFDCDGVMFDTAMANQAYYNQILENFDRPQMSEEQFVYTHMHTVEDSIKYIFDNNADLVHRADQFRKKMNYFAFIPYMEIEPYLKPLLLKLRTKYKLAVATNRTDTMNNVLKEHKLSVFFDLVVSALDVAHAKPAPDQLLKILNNFNAKAYEMIYIGDSELDEKAALKANVKFVAYNNKNLSADFHINSLKEMESILDL